MKQPLAALCAIAIVLSCCSKLEEFESAPERDVLQFTVSDEITKSYLSADESSWQFIWETGDTPSYFLMRNSSLAGSGVLTASRNNGQTKFSVYGASNFAEGDKLYPYFSASGPGSNPNAVVMSIPTEQVSEITEQISPNAPTVSLSLSAPSLDKTSASTTSSSSVSSIAPATRTLSFAIGNYISTNTYLVRVGNADPITLAPSSRGAASVSVSFPNASLSSSGSGSASTLVSVFAEGREGDAASVEVTANVTRTSSGSFPWQRSYTYNYSYSIGNPNAGVHYPASIPMVNRFTPVRDAMPLVSDPITLTLRMISRNADIQNDLYFYMLGSAIEFRVYSSDADIAVGETLKSVKVTSKGQGIAGDFTYDVIANTKSISGLSSQTVTSHVEDLGYHVPYGKSDSQSIYVIVAPGTYATTVDFETDSYHYIYNLASKTYSRATRKVLNADFSASSATRVKIEEPVEPDDPAEPSVVYAMFNTDRHSNIGCNGKSGTTESDNMSQSWMYNILSYIHNTTAYDISFVSYGGDMVGDIGSGSSKPTANTSSFKNEVTSVFPDAQVIAVKAAHDANVTDNAGILYSSCQAIDCGEYYVYTLPQDYMSSSSNATTAANAFVSWAATVDPSKPIIVDSHMPTIKNRGDNAGATAWHKAMNQVATGSANGTSVVRDVIFFSGHNHTVDKNEYYYAPGSSMAVQGTSGNVTIYYTYSVCGYLASGFNATLMTLTDDEITLEKYNMSGRVVTSTNHPDYTSSAGTKHVITRHK